MDGMDFDSVVESVNAESVALKLSGHLPSTTRIAHEAVRDALRTAFHLRVLAIESCGAGEGRLPTEMLELICTLARTLISQCDDAESRLRDSTPLIAAAGNGESAHIEAVRFAKRVALPFRALHDDGELNTDTVRSNSAEIALTFGRVAAPDMPRLLNRLLVEALSAKLQKVWDGGRKPGGGDRNPGTVERLLETLRALLKQYQGFAEAGGYENYPIAPDDNAVAAAATDLEGLGFGGDAGRVRSDFGDFAKYFSRLMLMLLAEEASPDELERYRELFGPLPQPPENEPLREQFRDDLQITFAGTAHKAAETIRSLIPHVEELAASPQAKGDVEPREAEARRPIVDLKKLTVTLNRETWHVQSEQALRWLKVLAERPGQWVGPDDAYEADEELLDIRSDRLKRHLPERIASMIESQRGVGCRLLLNAGNGVERP